MTFDTISCMAKIARSIELDRETLSRIDRAVRVGVAEDVLAFVREAIEEKLQRVCPVDCEEEGGTTTPEQHAAALRTLLADDFERTGGPPTPAEIAWADQVLGRR